MNLELNVARIELVSKIGTLKKNSDRMRLVQSYSNKVSSPSEVPCFFWQINSHGKSTGVRVLNNLVDQCRPKD